MKPINAFRSAVNTPILLIVVIGTLSFLPTAHSQQPSSDDDPLASVRQFKSKLDADDIPSMCALLTESDRSAPLTRLHFESMQMSMSELVKLWRYTPFTYGGMEISSDKTPNQAFVHVTAYQLKQEVRFTLLQFDSSWYIADIEIFFK